MFRADSEFQKQLRRIQENKKLNKKLLKITDKIAEYAEKEREDPGDNENRELMVSAKEKLLKIKEKLIENKREEIEMEEEHLKYREKNVQDGQVWLQEEEMKLYRATGVMERRAWLVQREKEKKAQKLFKDVTLDFWKKMGKVHSSNMWFGLKDYDLEWLIERKEKEWGMDDEPEKTPSEIEEEEKEDQGEDEDHRFHSDVYGYAT